MNAVSFSPSLIPNINSHIVASAMCIERTYQGLSFLQESVYCTSTWVCGFIPKRQSTEQRKTQPSTLCYSPLQFSFLFLTHGDTHILIGCCCYKVVTGRTGYEHSGTDHAAFLFLCSRAEVPFTFLPLMIRTPLGSKSIVLVQKS